MGDEEGDGRGGEGRECEGFRLSSETFGGCNESQKLSTKETNVSVKNAQRKKSERKRRGQGGKRRKEGRTELTFDFETTLLFFVASLFITPPTAPIESKKKSFSLQDHQGDLEQFLLSLPF